MRTTTMMLVLALGALAVPAVADAVDDDLAVVKKATASNGGPAVTAEAPPRQKGDEPRWFRVRIIDKGEKKATVKVNLPLALVHALGDDVPVPGCGERENDRHLTLGEVLRALDSGESLVEIEDEQSTVRVWVE
jgi:hypothetical protein